MAHVHLITGGCRSGKSGYAQQLAEELPRSRCYIATCPVTDEEMAERVRRHQLDRANRGWRTVEEQLNPADVIRNSEDPVILLDCVTVWVSNLMYDAEQAGKTLDEDTVGSYAQELLGAFGESDATIILVTNEVGLGVVPDNAVARTFRDFAGRCNQVLAHAADEVTFMACGLPLTLKGK